MKKDIKLPYKKPKKTFKSLKKSLSKYLKKQFKKMAKYFKPEKAKGGKSLQTLIMIGLIFGVVALMLGLIPNLNSFGAWVAVMALAIGLLAYLNKSGGRTKQLLLLSTVALVVCVASVSIQNGLRQLSINDTIDRREGRATQVLLKKDITITFGEYKNDGLSVTLLNRNSSAKTYSIVVVAKDESGNDIIDQSVSFGILDPKEERKYKIFSTASDIIKDKLKTATFEVISVSQY